MNRFEMFCPFCGRPVEIVETTTPERREVGLVYLATKCVPCDARIEAAGVGEDGAREDMKKRFAARIGTSQRQWRITPRPERGHRR